jgi:7,8-dihydropterin-6-yl-methyl-4-(beta-D-ribofuranosyl)aminobenzene 5'-phosphate synthase
MRNKLRITVLCENSVGPVSGTLGEHGFAALLEGEGLNILFDTGMGETLLRNAQRMNRDLHRVSQVVLSHGHCDHTGGLLPLLRNCGGKEVFAHPAVFSRRYRVKDSGESVPIGIPYEEAFLRGLKARFNLDNRFREIAPGVFLTGEVPRKTAFEKGDRGMFLDPEGHETDPIKDDQSLAIRTSKGLVLLLGCCHAGLVNTIEYARAQTGEERLYAVIGGTHLNFCSHEQTEATVRALKDIGIGKISASHCTGFAASARLQREFPGEFHPANVGYMLETG